MVSYNLNTFFHKMASNMCAVKKSLDFTVKYLEFGCQFTCRYFLRASTCRTFLQIKIATVLCLIPENVSCSYVSYVFYSCKNDGEWTCSWLPVVLP